MLEGLTYDAVAMISLTTIASPFGIDERFKYLLRDAPDMIQSVSLKRQNIIMDKLILYHGSSQIVSSPEFGRGRPYNDYGFGFYCAEHRELACEWACAEEGVDGFVNEYLFELEGLRVLGLSYEPYTILHWLVVLL